MIEEQRRREDRGWAGPMPHLVLVMYCSWSAIYATLRGFRREGETEVDSDGNCDSESVVRRGLILEVFAAEAKRVLSQGWLSVEPGSASTPRIAIRTDAVDWPRYEVLMTSELGLKAADVSAYEALEILVLKASGGYLRAALC